MATALIPAAAKANDNERNSDRKYLAVGTAPNSGKET